MKRLFNGVILMCLATLMAACDKNENIQQEQDGDKIKISLTFNIANSPLSTGGPMAGTKGTAEDMFDAIYEGIVSGEIVAAYELTFTNKSTGATTIFNGRWNDGKTISIEKGSYTITGACTAAGNGIYSQCSLTLQDEATITEQTTTVKIKAQYDCSLLILNDETVDKVVYYANDNDSTYFAQYKTLTYAFLRTAADFTQNGEAFLKVYFKNGKNSIVNLGKINIQKGMYYLLENLNNYIDAGIVLDIDKMQHGDDSNNNGNENNDGEREKTIEFRLTNSSPATRAIISNNSDVANNGGFKVWGFKDTGSSWVTVLNGETVSSTDYGNTWTYAPKRYWDTSANGYRFYAAAPVENANGTIEFSDYTVCVNNVHYMKAGDNEMECKVHRGVVTTWDSFSGQVEFSLQHIMSRITIQFKKPDNFYYDIKLKEISLEGWNGGNGNYRLNVTSSATDASEWTIPVTTSGVVNIKQENGLLLPNYYVTVGDYLMIPQSIDANALKLRIKYYIENELFEYTCILNEGQQIIWATGGRIDYYITISPEVIISNYAVSSWTDETTSIVL